MAIAVVLLLLGQFSAANPSISHTDLGNGVKYSFEQYLSDFKKNYTGEQLGYRKSIFNEHLKKIREHNANPDHEWYMHVNRFTDLHPNEFRKITRGVHPAATRKTVVSFEQQIIQQNYSLLKKVEECDRDWRKEGVVTEVNNQGACGSCWAFSAAETIESHLLLGAKRDATNLNSLDEKYPRVSEQELISCSENLQHCGGDGGCLGSTQSLAFKYASEHGIHAVGDYGTGFYESAGGSTGKCQGRIGEGTRIKCDSWVDLPTNNYAELMNAVCNKGPVSISLDAASFEWMSYHSGILRIAQPQMCSTVDHAVQLVGVGEEKGQKYWIIRNSWGTEWGESGFVRLARSTNDDKNCVWDTKPSDGYSCLDENGKYPEKVWVCGTCGILSSSSYPVGCRVAEDGE